MAPVGGTAVSDHVALAEIEWCGELMIAAAAAIGERLTPDRIDEVLEVVVPRRAGQDGGERGAAGPGSPAARIQGPPPGARGASSGP